MKVTVRYWSQDTQESGHWQDIETTKEDADVMLFSHLFDRAYILEDDEIEGNQPFEDQKKSD